MKRFLLVLSIFILFGCSSKEPLTEYIKEDVVIETGSKITINDVVKVNDIKNEELKKHVEDAKVIIDYKDNEVIDKKDVKEDKIFASNIVKIIYSNKDKENELEVKVKIKDTEAPEVVLNNDYYFVTKGTTKTKDEFIKELDLKVSDNGKYTIDIEGFDNIDFSKAKENKLKLVVSDEANNIVKKNIILSIKEKSQSIVYNVPANKQANISKVILNIPSTLTSNYSISEKINEYGNLDITFSNANEKIKVNILIPYAMEYYDYNIKKEYVLNNFDIMLLKPAKVNLATGKKNKNYGKKENKASIHSNKYIQVGYVVTIEKGESQGQLKWFVDNVVNNTQIK